MRPIRAGDIVTVLYVDESQLIDVEVIHVSGDIGDFWYFKDSEGNIYAQNPRSSNLDTIIRSVEQ
ncbi:MAG: hypothetical protein AMJ88_13605 [Anaerolineae bacterium SM23_ 63]|nr:MAG: hypothetical protein AMJ88_13605 [Anaerolineae bacterium SM23_ 63]